jgi:hypothetical protein
MATPPTPDSHLPPLKLTTGWTSIEIVSEPGVLTTFKGYAPAIAVRTVVNSLEYSLYLSAKSLMECLEPLRKANGGHFTGLALKLRKESDSPMAKYVAEPL